MIIIIRIYDFIDFYNYFESEKLKEINNLYNKIIIFIFSLY